MKLKALLAVVLSLTAAGMASAEESKTAAKHPEPQTWVWDGVFGKLVQSRAWREEIEKHYWLDTYLDSAASRQFLATDYLALKAALTDLGLVR